MTDKVKETLGSEEFFRLMQEYRHSPLSPQEPVCKAFEDVKQFILSKLNALELERLDEGEVAIILRDNCKSLMGVNRGEELVEEKGKWIDILKAATKICDTFGGGKVEVDEVELRKAINDWNKPENEDGIKCVICQSDISDLANAISAKSGDIVRRSGNERNKIQAKD